jgi:hypothetical protein
MMKKANQRPKYRHIPHLNPIALPEQLNRLRLILNLAGNKLRELNKARRMLGIILQRIQIANERVVRIHLIPIVSTQHMHHSVVLYVYLVVVYAQVDRFLQVLAALE